MIYESPIWFVGNNEVSFVGELGKWTAVSPQRFYNIDFGPDRVYIYMRGVAQELINMRFTVQAQGDNPKIVDWSCTIPASGRTTLIMLLEDESKGIPKIYFQDS